MVQSGSLREEDKIGKATPTVIKSSGVTTTIIVLFSLLYQGMRILDD
jgi:hypothetical protein